MPAIFALLRQIALLGIIACLANSLHAADHWSAQRAMVREQRQLLEEQASADRLRRAQDSERAIAKLLSAAEKNPVPDQRSAIATLLDGLAQLDAALAAPLRERLKALPEPPEKVPRMAQRNWQRALDLAKREALTRTGDLLNRAIELGIHDLAYDFLLEILSFDPDNEGIRRGLGQVKANGRWLDKHDQQMAKQGYWWDEKIGWILLKEQARYDGGEYFDLQSRRWTTIARANQLRSQPGNEWVIETGNITLRTTLDLSEAVAMANRLNGFYQGVFAAYAGFFTNGPSDYKLVMGLLEHEPLIVWIYRDEDQFRRYALSQVRMPEWAAGFWSSSLGASFFYIQSSGSLTTMFHEFTHQIFHVFSGTNQAPSWITEGLAVYNETPVIGEGRIGLGTEKLATRVNRHRKNARAGQQVKLRDLLLLNHTTWSAAVGDTVSKNYEAAGALVWYCMEIEGRKYRADFIEYARDAYLGNTGSRDVWDYLGLDAQTFQAQYEAWEKAP